MVYAFLDTGSKSALWSVMQWQAAGGMSYVADVNRRLMEGFRSYGNASHLAAGQCDVSFEEFMEGIFDYHKEAEDSGVTTDAYEVNELI